MSQQLISLLKDIGRVKIDLNALSNSEDGSEDKRQELQAQLDKLMEEHAQLMKGGGSRKEDAKPAEPPAEPPAGEGSFEEKERLFRAKAPTTNGAHRGELARLLERQRRKASEEGLNFTAGGAVSTADALAESPQKEDSAHEPPEGRFPDAEAQDLPGSVDGTSARNAEEEVTYPPSPPSPASPAPWEEDTMIIHHVLPGAHEASGLESVVEPMQEAEEEEDKEEELGEVVQTRGMGGRSMSGSSVRFQHEPDVVHFDTDVPDKEEPLAIASEPAEAEPAEAEAPSTAPAQAGEPAEAVEKPDLAGGPASEVEAADTAEPAEAEPVAKSLQPLLQATQLEPESSDAQPVASNATDVGHAPKQAAPEAPEAPEAAVATAVAPASQSLAAAAELATTTRPKAAAEETAAATKAVARAQASSKKQGAIAHASRIRRGESAAVLCESGAARSERGSLHGKGRAFHKGNAFCWKGRARGAENGAAGAQDFELMAPVPGSSNRKMVDTSAEQHHVQGM
ncbi:unnamed protein product [Symbiodinium natans]|uniref:Uncharacterized protein n=1 Tax=Symbiodinium natans TaxID=878477 RepID=A0A812I8R0_9DINO|nr:unnamed protein product [Symbiodinium natans]